MICVSEHIFSWFISVISYLSDHFFLLLKSWPFILLLVAWLFRVELKRLIAGIETVEAGNTKVTLKQEKPSDRGLLEKPTLLPTPSAKKSGEKVQIPPFPPGDFKAVMDDRENKLREWIKEFPYETTSVLIRELASFQLAVEYELLYYIAFKSQLDLLERLAGEKNALHRSVLISAFDKLKEEYPRAYLNYSFDNWISFLTLNSLAIEENSSLKITDNGRAFISYIINQRGYDITAKHL